MPTGDAHPPTCDCQFCNETKSERKILHLIPVEDHTKLGRDPFSKAIIVNDPVGLKKAREAKEKMRLKKLKEASQETRLNKLEEDISDIKQMLHQLLTKQT